MPIWQPQRKRVHDMFVELETELLTRHGRFSHATPYEEGKPDLFANDPRQAIEVKSLDAKFRVAIAQPQFDRFIVEYLDALHYALWVTPWCRLLLPGSELLERAIPAPGTFELVRPSHDARPAFYVLDFSDDYHYDMFSDPWEVAA